jgi:hypothetical protein
MERIQAEDKALDDYLVEKYDLNRQLTEAKEKDLNDFLEDFELYEEELKKVQDVAKRKILTK